MLRQRFNWRSDTPLIRELSRPHRQQAKIDSQLGEIVPKLEQLKISSYGTDIVMPHTEKLPTLQELEIVGSKINSKMLSELLINATNLRILKINVDNSLNYLKLPRGALIHLKKTELRGVKISAEGLKILLKSAPNLDVLDLSNSTLNPPIIDEELRHLLGHVKWVHGLEPIPALLKRKKEQEDRLAKEMLPSREPVSSPPVIEKPLEKSESIMPTGDVSKKPEDTPDVIPQPPLPVEDPIHDPHRFLNQTPTDPDFQFKYRGINKTKNQGMIIEKLSQFLTLTGQHVAYIPKLQKGICNSLAHYFIKKSPVEWQAFMKEVADWNGGASTLTKKLKSTFNDLFDEVKKYNLSPHGSSTQYHYIGDDLLPFLFSEQKPYVLHSAWHAISVYPTPTHDAWIVYDPNFVNGPREVKKEDLLDTIQKAIGNHVRLESIKKYKHHAPKISDPAKFIEEGGLLLLTQCTNAPEMLTQMKPPLAINKEALNGILLRNVEGVPAWVHGLEYPTLSNFTHRLLQQFIEKNPLDYGLQLQRSINALTPFKKQELITCLIQQQHPKGCFPHLFSRRRVPAASAEYYDELITIVREASPSKIDKKRPLKPPSEDERKIDDAIPTPLPHLTELASQGSLTKEPSELEVHRTDEGSPLPVPVVTSAVLKSKTVDYEHALETWNKKKSVTSTLNEYCQTCVAQGEVKKRLIEFSSDEDVDAMHYALLKHAKDTHRPVFYVNSPSDLVCSAPYVARDEDNHGTLRRGPGGALYDFLEKAKADDSSPILIVNYDNFDADDIVRFNTLVDKDRKADGTDLPDKTIVIGLINVNHPDNYQGADFYSRMDLAESCPIDSEPLQHAIPKMNIMADDSGTAISHAINLYHSADWRERLLGRWVLDEDKLTYQEGELQKAQHAGATTFDIQNGLWDDKEFLRFWQEASQAGEIIHAGRTIPLPADFAVSQHEGYPWEHLKTHVQPDEVLSDEPHKVLNPTTIGDFFNRYRVNETGQLEPLKGLIEEAAFLSPSHASVKTLKVHLTRAIGEDEWAMLLDECQRHNVRLTIYCAPGVTLPVVLQSDSPPMSAPTPAIPPWDKTLPSSTHVIQSSDVDTTLALLPHDTRETIIIDVAECHGSDLLTQMNGNLNKESLRFEFSTRQCAVLNALADNKRVILKGHFSAELADELAPLLIERQNLSAPLGSLILITEDTASLSYVPQQDHHVSTDEKIACLGELTPEIIAALAPFVEEESLSKLKTRRDYLVDTPDALSDAAWAGMYNLPREFESLETLDATTSYDKTLAFTESRLKAVNTILARAPYVFLSGLSGVGKSTFVEKELCQEGDTLFHGESHMKEWATASSESGRPILFIDEANLSPQQWSEFEGLFNDPPGILVEGTFYPLSKDHKVVFAGNPVSYGDERKLAPFFARHGNAVVFEPIPTAALYEKVLKPVFAGTLLEGKSAEISSHLLDVYRFLCTCSTTDVLISPRELQMMALMVVSHYSQQDEPQSLETITEHFAYHLAKQLVPEEHRALFDEKFKPKATLLSPAATEPSDFLITESRAHVSQFLDEMLALRELRQETSANPVQQFGGLGGLILDGEPGIGKSELVISALRARGYDEMHDFEKPATSDKPFYRMPVSMSPDEKEKLLVKAFHEGAVIIIDEINSSPMMERLLNALLTGKSPDGKTPTKPGFMVIGTQNPVTMAGRHAASTALLRRMATLELSPYSTKEACEILVLKGLPLETAEAMATAYEKQVALAAKLGKTPAPTFRDLIKLANLTLKAHIKKQDHSAAQALKGELDPNPTDLTEATPRQAETLAPESKEAEHTRLQPTLPLSTAQQTMKRYKAAMLDDTTSLPTPKPS
ncbi:MAG: AAA family ATPase [Legionellaceae bacterium]